MELLKYILPLAAGFLYTLAAILSKRALELGAGTMRITFIANLLAIPAFLPLLLIDTQVHDWSLWWAPIACGLGNFGGMALTFAALNKGGDVTIQAPIMGSKTILVAIFAIFAGLGPIPIQWWIAALLSVLAITVLSWTRGVNINKKSALRTVNLSLLSAISFAACDVIMADYAPEFGETTFLIFLNIITALASFSFIPFFKGGLLQLPKPSLSWVWLGCIAMALEGFCFYVAVSFYGNPTAANILYSSRGIWSVLLIWSLGHWFKNNEKESGSAVMTQRLIGAILLFIAIILVIITPKVG